MATSISGLLTPPPEEEFNRLVNERDKLQYEQTSGRSDVSKDIIELTEQIDELANYIEKTGIGTQELLEKIKKERIKSEDIYNKTRDERRRAQKAAEAARRERRRAQDAAHDAIRISFNLERDMHVLFEEINKLKGEGQHTAQELDDIQQTLVTLPQSIDRNILFHLNRVSQRPNQQLLDEMNAFKNRLDISTAQRTAMQTRITQLINENNRIIQEAQQRLNKSEEDIRRLIAKTNEPPVAAAPIAATPIAAIGPEREQLERTINELRQELNNVTQFTNQQNLYLQEQSRRLDASSANTKTVAQDILNKINYDINTLSSNLEKSQEEQKQKMKENIESLKKNQNKLQEEQKRIKDELLRLSKIPKPSNRAKTEAETKKENELQKNYDNLLKQFKNLQNSFDTVLKRLNKESKKLEKKNSSVQTDIPASVATPTTTPTQTTTSTTTRPAARSGRTSAPASQPVPLSRDFSEDVCFIRFDGKIRNIRFLNDNQEQNIQRSIKPILPVHLDVNYEFALRTSGPMRGLFLFSDTFRFRKSDFASLNRGDFIKLIGNIDKQYEFEKFIELSLKQGSDPSSRRSGSADAIAENNEEIYRSILFSQKDSFNVVYFSENKYCKYTIVGALGTYRGIMSQNNPNISRNIYYSNIVLELDNRNANDISNTELKQKTCRMRGSHLQESFQRLASESGAMTYILDTLGVSSKVEKIPACTVKKMLPRASKRFSERMKFAKRATPSIVYSGTSNPLRNLQENREREAARQRSIVARAVGGAKHTRKAPKQYIISYPYRYNKTHKSNVMKKPSNRSSNRMHKYKKTRKRGIIKNTRNTRNTRNT